MPAPEINVRLTADGVQDVVNAFKRVQQESRTTKTEVNLLGEAMGQLGELMPVLTIGAAVEKTVGQSSVRSGSMTTNNDQSMSDSMTSE